MSEQVTLDGFMNMKLDGTVELLDGAHNVVARLYSRASNDLEEQNAKLREFAGQVLYFTTMTDGCGDNCPYSSSDCSHECHLREQGRELGVEVSE